MNFRNDINALRAISVLAVMIFHFKKDVLPGGFIGVDIFFVISGYLMTCIIYKKITNHQFSLMGFYADRAWRIIPAVLALCIFLLVFGYFTLLPLDYRMLAKHVTSAIFFVSNIVFYKEAGYFDAISSSKFLLHTWSLAVEWQFYMIYPIIFMMVAKLFPQKTWRWFFLALTVSSFIFAAVASYYNPSFSYYSLPTRAWEMLAGGLVFLFPLQFKDKHRSYIAYAAVAVIAVSLFVVSDALPWPGLGALAPVLAAVAFLYATYQHSIILNSWVMQWLGKNSYSIYLWHWPIFAYIYIKNNAENNWVILAGLLASILMGAISYRWIESNVKRGMWSSISCKWRIIKLDNIGFVAIFIVPLFLSVFVYKNNGFPMRLGEEVQKLSAITDVYTHFNYQKEIRYAVCHSVTAESRDKDCLSLARKQAFIFGDSYAASLYPGVKQIIQEKYPEYSISQMTDGNGPPFLNSKGKTDEGHHLGTVNKQRIEQIAQLQPEIVLMTWMINGSNGVLDAHDAVKALAETIHAIQAAAPATKVVVLGPVPHWESSLLAVVLNYWNSKGAPPPPYLRDGLVADIANWDAVFHQKIPATGATYISSYRVFCPSDQGCLTYLGQDIANLTAVDWGHLTRNASIYLMEAVGEKIFTKP